MIGLLTAAAIALPAPIVSGTRVAEFAVYVRDGLHLLWSGPTRVSAANMASLS